MFVFLQEKYAENEKSC